MKTPKDKAKELYYIYYDIMNPNDDRARYRAIKCAKIAVDEILELNIAWIDEDIQKDYPKRFDLEQTSEFWQEVKNELNNML